MATASGAISSVSDENSVNHHEANLANDALLPPAPWPLTITASNGALLFNWPKNHDADRIELYVYDSITRSEVRLTNALSGDTTAFRLPVSAHRIAWNSRYYRVELCTDQQCISSQRVSVADLFAHFTSTLSAADSIPDDFFGEHIALNQTGNIAVISARGIASAYVYFRLPNGSAGSWIEASKLTLPLLPSEQPDTPTAITIPRIGSIRVALSRSGDTLALAWLESSNNSTPHIAVYDRLGENWIHTGTPIPLLETPDTATVTQPDHTVSGSWQYDSLSLQLAADGQRLVMGAVQQSASDSNDSSVAPVWVFERGAAQWQQSATITVPIAHQRLASIATTARLDSLFLLSTHLQQTLLHSYELEQNNWHYRGAYEVPVLPYPDSTIVSKVNGLAVAIAGWERSANDERTPVLWRYDRHADTAPATSAFDSESWHVTDSVRLPGTDDTSANLRLTADATFDTIALGWNAAASATVFVYHQSATNWQSTLVLPEDLNHTAKEAFMSGVAISANGDTLMLGTAQPLSTTDGTTGGLVRVVQ